MRVESVVHEDGDAAATERVREFAALASRRLPALFADASRPAAAK